MSEIILSLLPYAAGVVAAIAGIVGIFISGRQAARNDIKRESLERENQALRKAREVDHEISEMDEDALRAHAIKRGWVRNDSAKR